MRYIIFDDMTQCTPQEVQRLLPLVPDERRTEALRYRHLFGQYACLKTYAMLADLLVLEGHTAPLPPFCRSEHGKPFFAPETGLPHFSISHCPAALAVAISDRPIGIDIERIRPVSEALIEHCMNADETHLILHAPEPARAFTRLWTRKEALFKLLGTGITDDLRDILATSTPTLLTLEDPTHDYITTIAH